MLLKPKIECCVAKFSMDLTWERLILSKKQPKIIFSRNRLVQVQLRGVSAIGD